MRERVAVRSRGPLGELEEPCYGGSGCEPANELVGRRLYRRESRRAFGPLRSLQQRRRTAARLRHQRPVDARALADLDGRHLAQRPLTTAAPAYDLR